MSGYKITKLRLLWHFCLSDISRWYREIWKQDGNASLCCSGYECGCQGACYINEWEWGLRRITERNKDDVVVEVEFEATPYDPGNTYGLPENCYPPEGGEIEIIKCLLADGADAEATDDETERWSTWLLENPEEAGLIDDRCDYD